MKLLLKKLANTSLGISIRNNFNFKNVLHKQFNSSEAISVSDSFLWRTDNNFKTKFKFTDILNMFYKIKNSRVEIHIYSKNNTLLKIEKIQKLNLSNEFVINAEYLDGLKDYGVFYIFHYSKTRIEKNNAISNRCYLGYSQNDSLYSFVHGNTYAKYNTIFTKGKINTNIVNTTIFKNQNTQYKNALKDLTKTNYFLQTQLQKS